MLRYLHVIIGFTRVYATRAMFHKLISQANNTIETALQRDWFYLWVVKMKIDL